MLDNAFQRRREIERMLLSGKKLTTAKLMSKYGVGKNAIRRDFDIIGGELPLIVKQGYDGGYFQGFVYDKSFMDRSGKISERTHAGTVGMP